MPDAPTPDWIPPEACGKTAGRGRLGDRRILVVGGGQRANDDPDQPVGNGRAICLLAAREGAAVACADIDLDSAQDTVDRIEAEGGMGVALRGDATVEADVEDMVTGTVAALGGIDGLVLNVGFALGRDLAGTSVEHWDQIMAVNLRSHFLACKAALPQMDPGSAIVFISSIAGTVPGSRRPAYDASKAALNGLCRHVALEGRHMRIRANVVAPGLIDTPLGRLATQGRPSRARTPVPLGRQGFAWEIGYPTIFLLSDEASYITGQMLVVDGGLTALL